MTRRIAIGVLAVVSTVAAGLHLATATVVGQGRDGQQVPGAFRGKVVLVPVDVRVLDRDGNPVTDLTQEDFTVFEAGRPQRLGHFSTQAFTALSAADSTPALRRTAGLETTPVTHRTFLIVLGRGRLKEPANGMDAILDFARTRLLPQDQVGVLAYNRAYGLTTDRDGVIRLLESFRDRHEEIEARLDHWFSGLTLRYGSRQPPPGIQARVDELFEAASVTGLRELAIGSYGDDQFDKFRKVMVGQLVDPDLDREDDFFNPREGYDDIRNLFAGIEFLRYLEGEKHILFLSENGLALPGRRVLEPGWSAVGIEAQKQYYDFASLAADARVSISPIGTGGLTTRWAAGVFVAANASRGDNYALAEQTGGLASFYRFADQAVDRIDRATRFQYLLGYYPEATTWDGGFREIRVAVNRPDVTVHFRKGYFAKEELVPYDRREFMSHSRVMAAATDSRPIRDVRLSIGEPVLAGAGADRTLEVEVAIDARDLSFGTVNSERVAALHVAVFVGDRREALIGEQWDVVDLRFDEATYARLQGQAFPHRVKVALSGNPAHVKVIVYDYRADRIGTAERALR